MIKPHILFDNNNLSIKIKNFVKKKLGHYAIAKSDLIVVIGGDGFMLGSLKKYHKYNKKFYGINSGNYGFLMNKFSNKHTLNNLSKSLRVVTISPLEMIVRTKSNLTKRSIAINEVSILRQSKQAASLSISSNSKTIIKNLVSDGVLVSTPAGSTAYNLSVHGPILGIDSKKLAISPISPFRPRRWKGKVVTDRAQILIKNLDPKKRPIAAVADNNEIRNIISIKASVNKMIKFKLLFNTGESLLKKIKSEQKRKIS